MAAYRDGLVDTSPYWVNQADDSSALDLAPDELADRLCQAVARSGRGEPAPRPAVPLAMSLGRDRESDVRQLIAVSDALRASAPSAKTKETPC
ncbi:hypothetical protein ACIOJD_09140 [Streptomyces sp. NPDC088116]|uniref:hypothetical protein n=1 Tax=Streptomyces sp. NPDC088116 TaxID=3365825 RepID=UPI0038186528